MKILVIAEDSHKLSYIRDAINWKIEDYIVLYNSKNGIAMVDYPQTECIQIDFKVANEYIRGYKVDQIFTYGHIDNKIMDFCLYPCLAYSCVPEEFQLQKINLEEDMKFRINNIVALRSPIGFAVVYFQTDRPDFINYEMHITVKIDQLSDREYIKQLMLGEYHEQVDQYSLQQNVKVGDVL